MNNLKMFTSFVGLLWLVMSGSLISAYGQITPSQDAYTDTAKPTANFGTSTTLGVNSGGSIQTTYIQFDLSSIPAGYTSSNIAKASLKLYVNTVTTAGSLNVDFVNGAWAEKKITASLSPALGTTIVGGVALTNANVHDYIVIDITAALAAWLDGTQANDGIALVGNSPLSATFDSKENTTQSHPAELDIVFSGSGKGGGTITGVTAGSGLAGGGTSGNVTLSLLKTCAANQVLQWNGTTWVCATIAGSGTITGVIAGTDLTGGGTSGKVTLNLNTTALQTANDARYAQLGAANTYSQAQLVKGTTSAMTAFVSDPAGVGVLGYATTNGAGSGVGVEGLSATTNGVGVLGSGAGSQGVGVQGSGFVGVSGASAATGGIGVQGTASGSNGTGVLGKDNGGSGTGVAGVGKTGVFGSGLSNGIWGQGTASGTGVFGQSTTGTAVWGQSSSGNGVYGQTAGTSGLVGGNAAVLGDSQNFFGVWGASSVTDGVHGTCTGNCAGVGGDNKQGGYGLFGYAATGDNTKPGTGVYGETFGTGSVRPGFGSDGVDGVAHNNNSGVAGINDGSGPGVFGINKSAGGGSGVFGTSANGFGFQTDTNVSQARGAGGWVKAMAYVDPFAQGGVAITRCYNSQASGAMVSTPPCGISIVHNAAGGNTLDFGFQVNDRFIGVSCPTSVVIASADTSFTPPNQVSTSTWNAQAAIYDDFPFTIFVY